jgi:hypothetical protein
MARKSKPKSVVVCGHTVTIKWYKPKADEIVENWGLFDPNKNEIFLIDWKDWPRILQHEILHSILHYSGHSNGLKNEEAIVTALEYGLWPLFKLR